MNDEILSKNEQKRRLKADEKLKKKNECTVVSKINEDELDSEQFYEMRCNQLKATKMKGIDTQPHFYHEDMDLSTFLNRYGDIAIGTHLEEVVISLSGRVMAKRESGSKLFFLDIVSGKSKLQVLANSQFYESSESFIEIKDQVKRGDIIGVKGYPGKSKLGEISILPIQITVLTPCLRQLPHPHYGLKDQETRYRSRYLDLIMNEHVAERFIKRTQIIKYIEAFLDNLGFLRVETPILNVIPGGAAAAPFLTHHNDFNMKMYMRIAPELFLKQLLVGGLKRVYEIGKQFRNEGVDLTHNPEFTTCEAYITGADYNTWMSFTESLLSGMANQLHGSNKVTYTSHGEDVIIDFSTPFARIDLMSGLEAELGHALPAATELHTEESRATLDKICRDRNIDCSGARTSARLLDKLVGEYLESKCINPTFIINHPEIMSPLAKYHRSCPGLTERFELFVMKKELANAYTELNDYQEQRSRFEQQAKDKAAGDDEAMFIDETFLDALAYGLPPCGGWGLGIDRLVMFMTNTESIREVIVFPTMKPDNVTVPTKNNEGNVTVPTKNGEEK